MQEWKIQKHGNKCHDTGREFEEGETFYSAIFWRDGEFERRDYSVDAWNARFGEEIPADDASARDEVPFSFWRTRRPRSDEPPRIPYQAAEDFFWRLVEDGGKEGSEGLRYTLALLLMRKRVLKLRETQRRRGRDVLVFEHGSEEGRTAEVADPGLEAEDIEQLEEQIRDLLFPHLARPKEPAASEGAAAEGAAAEGAAAEGAQADATGDGGGDADVVAGRPEGTARG